MKPWKPLGDMGHAIHMYAMSQGYSVVEQIGGHGVGLKFHEDPFVSYVSPKGTGEIMVPGMVFTIEPMINMGSPEFSWMTAMAGPFIQRMECLPRSGK